MTKKILILRIKNDYESKAEFLGMFGIDPDDKYIKGEILFDNIMNKN